MIRHISVIDFCTVLRTMLSAGVLAVLVLACAGTVAGAMWIVDDDGGAGCADMQIVEMAV